MTVIQKKSATRKTVNIDFKGKPYGYKNSVISGPDDDCTKTEKNTNKPGLKLDLINTD